MRPDVPRARVRAVDPRRRARLDARGPPPVRPRADARQPRPQPRERDGRRPGDAPADRSTSAKIRQARDTSALRIIFVSGSELGAELARRATDLFGPVVYNLYGSTEVAYATIATPDDLRAEPSTVGKVVRGSIVKLLDDHGKEVKPGETGRIFVGNISQFEGYTGGGNKELVEGLMSSGDVGHFDADGRLFIDGRDDEMIVSGGENVYPAEVEELLAGARGDRGGGGDRRGRRQVRPAAEGVRRAARGCDPERGRGQGLRQGQPRALQGPARGRVPRRAAPQPHRQGPQARAQGSRLGRRAGGGGGGGGPRPRRRSRRSDQPVWRPRKPSIRRQASSQASAYSSKRRSKNECGAPG